MYWSAALHSHRSHCSQLSHGSALWSIGGWAPHGPGQTGFQGGLAGPLKGDVLVSRSALLSKGTWSIGDGLPMDLGRLDFRAVWLVH